MKKIVFSLFVMGLGFSASAQNNDQEVAAPASNAPAVKKETGISKAAEMEDVNAEARITEMRHAVRNLEMRKQSISNDKTLTPEARKAKLDELAAEHDKLSQRMKSEALKN